MSLLLALLIAAVGCGQEDPPAHERVSIQLSHYAPDAGCLDVHCSASINAQSDEVTDNRADSTVGTVDADAMAALYDAVTALPTEGQCPANDAAPWRLSYALYPPPSIAERADLAVTDVPWCSIDQPALDRIRPLWQAAGGWWPATGA